VEAGAVKRKARLTGQKNKTKKERKEEAKSEWVLEQTKNEMQKYGGQDQRYSSAASIFEVTAL